MSLIRLPPEPVKTSLTQGGSGGIQSTNSQELSLAITLDLSFGYCGVWSVEPLCQEPPVCVHVACLQFSPMDGYFGQYTQTGGCFEQVVFVQD